MCPEKGCGKTFTRVENYKRHRESVHNEGQKVFECPACSARFARSVLIIYCDTLIHGDVLKYFRADRLTRHQKIHRRDRGFRCDLPDCGLSFNRSDLLVRHTQVVHKGMKRVQSKGSKGSKNDQDMIHDLMVPEPKPRGRGKNSQQNNSSHPQQNIQMVQMVPVQVSLGSSVGMSNIPFMNSGSAFHPSTSGQMMGQSSAVAIASSLQMLQKQMVPGMSSSSGIISSSSSSGPNQHQQSHPNQHHVNHSSSHAGASSSSSKQQAQHELSCKSQKQQTYVCADCGQSFKSQSNYYRHRKTHDDMPVVFCNEKGCNHQSFSRIDLYKRHRETVHKEGPQKVFECTICGAKFGRVDRLARHDREVHKGIKRNHHKTSTMIQLNLNHNVPAASGSIVSSQINLNHVMPSNTTNDNQSINSSNNNLNNNHPSFSLGLNSGFDLLQSEANLFKHDTRI